MMNKTTADSKSGKGNWMNTQPAWLIAVREMVAGDRQHALALEVIEVI